MEQYGASHLAVLAVFVVGAVAAIVLGRRHRSTLGPTRTSRAVAVAMAAVLLPFQVHTVVADFQVDSSLPIQLCDLASIAAIVALWTHRPLAVALTFFWGLTLTSQAVVTPSLGQDFPELGFFAFWCLHLLTLWAALYLSFGLHRAPGWREYGATVAATAVWAVAVYVFNVLANTNYGYLRNKPERSILDLFGPWPWYIAVEIVVIAAAWALLTEVTRPWRGSRRPRARSLPS